MRETITARASLLLLAAAVQYASTDQTASVVAAAGGILSAGSVTNVGVCGQCTEAGVSRLGTVRNSPGFLGMFSLCPAQDTDGDGQPNEDDADNDDDGLSDADEITGVAFGGNAATNPNDSDTDGDGMRDGNEAEAMFDPNDPTHRLDITRLTVGAEGQIQIEWIGRGGGTTNTIFSGTELRLVDLTNREGTVVAWHGKAPWYKAICTYSGSNANERAFYRVAVPSR